jgi:hypothetical protein
MASEQRSEHEPMYSATAPLPMPHGKAKIALVAFSSLGDGLIYLMMAENLRNNGYDVTTFGKIAYQIRHWLPQLAIQPYPAPEEFDAALAGYDLVIMSPPQFIRDRMDEARTDEMRRKWLLICQKCPSSWHFDHTERIRDKRDAETFEALRGLLDCSGSIRFREFTDESVVAITLEYMRHKMHLRDVDKQVALTPPAGLQHRRHRQRIVVSPDSAWAEKKNWPPRDFLRLCHTLKERGYDPKIVVAPANHERWAKRAGTVFETPQFHDIGQLSAYLYESGAVIANDSGNGHLASFLGVPVVTLYRKQNPNFHWRPDWGPGKVVCPRLTLPWIKGRIWKPFISPADIIAALETLP